MIEKKRLTIDNTPFVIEYENVDFDTDIETFIEMLNTDINNFDFN